MEVSAIQLTHKEFLSISQNYEGAAATADLFYVKDNVEDLTEKVSYKLIQD